MNQNNSPDFSHAKILQRMLNAIATQTVNVAGEILFPLAALTTRDKSDPAIALLDAWATVIHVLSFYQQQFNQESYLNTATELFSVRELGRMVDFELNPGVAASTYLAFTLDPTVSTALIPKGTKIQSLPSHNAFPQTFETSIDFVAQTEWNEIKAYQHFTIVEQTVTETTVSLKLAGVSAGLSVGDVLLLMGNTISSEKNAYVLIVQSIEIKAGENYTVITWQNNWADKSKDLYPNAVELKSSNKLTNLKLFVFRQRGGCFGNNAPQLSSLSPDSYYRTKENPNDWDNLAGLASAEKAEQLPLIIKLWQYAKMQTTDSNIVEIVFGNLQYAQAFVAELLKINIDDIDAPNNPKKIAKKINNDSGPISHDTGNIGHNTNSYLYIIELTEDEWDRLERSIDRYILDSKQDEEKQSHIPTVFQDSQAKQRSNVSDKKKIYLDQVLPKIIKSSWILLNKEDSFQLFQVDSAAESAIADFGITGRVTALTLIPIGRALTQDGNFLFRSTAIFTESEQLPLQHVQIPISSLKKKSDGIILNNSLQSLQPGQRLIISNTAAPQTEIFTLAGINNVTVDGAIRTRLLLDEDLKYEYQPATAVIYANVIPATHGETVNEVLGSGDGAKINQTFTLHKTPLTYLPASNLQGFQNTLTIYVNGVLWEQNSSLINLTANSQNYVVQHGENEQVTITFGDGKKGARLPTSQENVVATYRKGLGLSGNVAASSLILLQTRPQGVLSVTNPLPAVGGVDAEGLISAKKNTPLWVSTLGRIVSLHDFENFVQNFTGIDKTQATFLRLKRGVFLHITIAGQNGNSVETYSELYRNLINAITTLRNPGSPIIIESYQLLLFELHARIIVDATFLKDAVFNDITRVLQQHFGFEARSFGQKVSPSEVSQTIQRVAGVIAVDLIALDYAKPDQIPTSAPIKKVSTLTAQLARISTVTKGYAPAQLLLIDPTRIQLTLG